MVAPVNTNREQLCDLMVKSRASDLFMVAGAPLQLKINGTVTAVNDQRIMPDMCKQICNELMSPEQIKTFESQHELNFSFSLHGKGNFRVNLYRQRGSHAMVIRHLSYNIPKFDELALPEHLRTLIMESRGLILIVGATGSGKSTTIAALLNARAEAVSGHILTLEDPIEYLFPHRKSIISQREVGLDTATYSVALKNAMREAPDVLLIGEIRDRETMEQAIGYAQSGHLCVSTLHANNSYHALHRILNFFPTDSRAVVRMELASALKAIVAQRLIPRRDRTRVASVEILLHSRHVAELIEEGNYSSIKEAMDQGIIKGTQTFDQDLFRLYSTGQITLDEAMIASDSPSNLAWLINNQGMVNAKQKTQTKPEAVESDDAEDIFKEVSFTGDDDKNIKGDLF